MNLYKGDLQAFCGEENVVYLFVVVVVEMESHSVAQAGVQWHN